MAYNDSGELPVSQSTYSLGGYTFELKVQNVHEPGEPDVVSVFAICHGPDGDRETIAKDFSSDTQILNWYVEANETEASVYVDTHAEAHDLPTNLPKPIMAYTSYSINRRELGVVKRLTIDSDTPFIVTAGSSTSQDQITVTFVAPEGHTTANVTWAVGDEPSRSGSINLSHSYSIYGKTVLYNHDTWGYYKWDPAPSGVLYGLLPDDNSKWMAVYGDAKSDETVLVGRFAVDLREADGGPDGDWDEPGDTGDPSYTLNVFVTGASSGSNNGTPIEPGQTGGYGNGGTGGNGGGGGAGASTVIIYEFATDKAGTVNQEATAQGPGTGSPGGKGGKGGDGCILIFY